LALIDHARVQERSAGRRRRSGLLPAAYGDFLARLAAWSWFINPITFRGDAPCSDAAMGAICEWLADIKASAGAADMGWVICEEFGAVGGRWHAHGLISGVSQLERAFWWQEAFRRFGRTRIEPFDPERAGAFYAAKYAAKALGKIHFGGTLGAVELSRMVRVNGRRVWDDCLAGSSAPSHTHGVALPSADVERTFFRLGLRRWHR
jgi:hypothetical protein